MRVTSEFWITALMRRVLSSGGFAVLERRGNHDAGAIFVRIRARDGTEALFGPAPQISYDDERPGERLFAVVVEDGDSETVGKRLDKEIRFDSDVWVIEIEPGNVPIDDLLVIAKP